MNDSSAATPPPDNRRTSRSLLQRARDRQPGAWERLMGLYGPFVRHWCRLGRVAGQDVADVTQEVFARAFASLDNFTHHRPTDTFRGWLRTITRRRILDYYRRERRHIAAAGGSAAQGLLLDHPDIPLAPDAEERQLCDQLYDHCLEFVRGEFEPRSWQMFWRTVVDDQPSATVAAELGVSPTAVRQARSRILRRIREEVDEVDLRKT
jgi:RNA polymerase sigma-70 factor (ECF subfamily)